MLSAAISRCKTALTASHLHVVASDVLPEIIPLALVRRAAEAEEKDAGKAKDALHGGASVADTGIQGAGASLVVLADSKQKTKNKCREAAS